MLSIFSCQGYCNRTCVLTGVCHSSAIGFTCLCSSAKSSCQELSPPENLRLTWASSTAATFAWDYVPDALGFSAKVRNGSWESPLYNTTVTLAGFSNLSPNSEYVIIVQAQETETYRVSRYSELSFRTVTSSPEAGTTNICESTDVSCAKGVDECSSSATNTCHVEATCVDRPDGYSCLCNRFFVGNGTHCVGACDDSCVKPYRCFQSPFGSTCLCTTRGRKPGCQEPSSVPSGVHVVDKGQNHLVFGWRNLPSVHSYQAVLSSRHITSRYRSWSYVTMVPLVAFPYLEAGVQYQLSVSATNRIDGGPVAKFRATTDRIFQPIVTSSNIMATQFQVTVSMVPRVSALSFSYYAVSVDRDHRHVLNTSRTDVNITGLFPNTLYDVIVDVTYHGQLTQSSPITVRTARACLRGDLPCDVNAFCSNVTYDCECGESYHGDGYDCAKIYAQAFVQSMTSKGVDDDTLRKAILTSFQENNEDVTDVIIAKRNGTALIYQVHYTKPEINSRILTSAQNPLFSKAPVPTSDLCFEEVLENFSFAQSSRGSNQASAERCPGGQPAAHAHCVRVVSMSDRAFLLGSHYDRSLNVTSCPPLTIYMQTSSTIAPSVPIPKVVEFQTEQVKVKLPQEAIEQALKQLNVSGIEPTFKVESGDNFPSNYNVSVVITIEIGSNTSIENLTSPVQIQFKTENSSHGELRSINRLLDDEVVQRCVYWDDVTMQWSGRGCCLNNKLSPPTCECDHLTSFSLIVSTIEVPAGGALTVISDVGCGMSIAGSFVTFVIIALNKEARRKAPNKILLHLTMNMFITYTLFLSGVAQHQIPILCTTLASFLHYFFLVTWFWMAVYSNRLYAAFVKVFHRTGPHFMHKAAAIAYGLPLTVVALNIGLTIGHFDKVHRPKDGNLCEPDHSGHLPSFYRLNKFCWIHGFSLYFAFLAVIGLILINNIVVFVLVMRRILKRDDVRSNQAKRSRTTDVISACTLSFTLGVTWLFGFLMLLSTDLTYNYVMSWFFAVFNAFQGFFIWYITCVKREDMRKFWWQPIKNLFITCIAKCGIRVVLTNSKKMTSPNDNNEIESNTQFNGRMMAPTIDTKTSTAL
ncbi:unnamed protein product [Clavelina lepadiformis]|uniref:Uncharacterized protein n=1 Tax=Clavelina lepadiformis TaxID=159417 RepID=A0ABP0GQ16_CLALP